MKTAIKAFYEQLVLSRSTNPSHAPIIWGKELAKRYLYPVETLPHIPDSYWELFVACGNPWRGLDINSEWKFLDLGCGIGIDCQIASTFLNSSGIITGIDIAFEMVKTAKEIQESDTSFGHPPLFFLQADGESLPFRSESFDLIIANGVLSIFPDKKKAIKEIFRVLKSNGQFAVCDLVRLGALPEHFLDNTSAWAWCMAGASNKLEYQELFLQTGFKKFSILWNESFGLFARATMMGIK